MTLDYKAIKAKFSCIDVARDMFGLKLTQASRDEWRGPSPAPGPHKTDNAFSVSRSLWHDFSAGVGGDVLSLVAWLKFEDIKNVKAAAKFLAGDDNFDSGYWQKYTQQRDKLKHDTIEFHCFLTKSAQVPDEELDEAQREIKQTATQTLDYLHSRRINDKTIERFLIGIRKQRIYIDGSWVEEHRLTCPYLDKNGEPVYMVSRQLPWTAHEGSPKYHKLCLKDPNNVFLRNSIFGLNTIPIKDSECKILTMGEGTFDGLSLAQEGYPTAFAIGGDYGKDNIPTLIREARRFRRIVTCFDIDKEKESGQTFTCKIGRLFLKERLFFSCVDSYGEGHKDVSDYYAAGGDLHELVNNAVNGYVFMARRAFWENQRAGLLSEGTPFHELSPNEQARRLNEVKQFVFSLKGFLEDSLFSEVITALKEYYPPEKIDRFAQGPTAHELLCLKRDSFLDGRSLFYVGSIKHGEYWQFNKERGCWYRMTDADLQSELSEFFKHSLDNKTVAQLSMMIRLMVTRQDMPKFNRARVQVFTNGTLELDTGTLRENRPEDFMTWTHSFAYEPSATCPTYDAFLPQVACDQQSRIDFLDDIMGYAFYEDCRLEKMFVLIGDGQNGKGTYLKVLEALFKSDNDSGGFSQSVTNIQPKDFESPTQRILLEGSMLNIAHDIDPRLKDCASYLKSITSGDTIDGNFKFCDSHSFRPRTKIVCSSNHMLKVNDDSYGMKRRLMFCKFAACFKENADVHLLDKLLDELPGIFNRAFRTYKGLLEREAIRPSIDQAEFLEEFTEIANPVAAFWHEYGEGYLERREVSKSKVFDDFREFCERNSLYAGAENRFHTSLKKFLKEAGVNATETRHREQDNRPYYYVFTAQPVKSEAEGLFDAIENGTEPVELSDNDA